MAYKTLGEQRARLRNRLGFSAAGAAAGVNQVMIESFLQEAQVLLYWSHDWNRLRSYETKTLGASATLIDYPTLANPERIKAISVNRNDVWSPPLPKGISPQLYTTQTSMPSWPARWEPYDQIEIWPQSDQSYDLRIFYIKALTRFEQDGDRSMIDDDLIFQLALAAGKAHYRHPDAAIYKERADKLLLQLKAKNWSKDVFNPNDYAEEPMVKPVVV